MSRWRYDGAGMMPQLGLPVPGDPEWERYDNVVEIFLKAQKEAFVKQERN
jgi:hypothetical protein